MVDKRSGLLIVISPRVSAEGFQTNYLAAAIRISPPNLPELVVRNTHSAIREVEEGNHVHIQYGAQRSRLSRD